MPAPDLTTTDPRPFSARLEGYCHLPRMFDKARATLAGTNGTYLFGCPVDHTCMALLDIAPELVLDLVGRHERDSDVLAALQAHGIPTAEEAAFDGDAVEADFQREGYLRVRATGALPERDGGRAFVGAEHGAGVSVVLVDAPPGEAEERHTHPVEEVMVVTAGAARYFLGERQRRVVRAGEVVRVPAGVPHRYEPAGDERLHAVRIHGAPEIETVKRG